MHQNSTELGAGPHQLGAGIMTWCKLHDMISLSVKQAFASTILLQAC